jgi:plasmid stabilization system protein ParE
VIDALENTIQSLATFPYRFGVYETNRDPDRTVRKTSIHSFVIYYRVVEAEKIVEVVCIRRGARDRLPRFFR